jgi:hypothetical protein
MNDFTKDQFENVLVDVRKAYRLLYLYQKRVLDVIQYIGDSLDFRFGGGWNWFVYNMPVASKAKLTNSSWEWLSMYFYEFNFSERKVNDSTIKFSVILESDSGYFDSMNSFENIKSYSPVQQSVTKLIFMVGKNVWWDPDFKELFDDENLDIYKSSKDELIRSNEKGTIVVKCFPLSRFINAEETNKCIGEWVGFLNINGIQEIVPI